MILLITLETAAGRSVAEVHVNTLHQLTAMMPESVVAYDVVDNGMSVHSPVSDSELHDLLAGLVQDIENANEDN